MRGGRKKTTVVITKVAGHWSDREAVVAATRAALDLLPDWHRRAVRARRIVLKPNVGADNIGWETGAVTSPHVLEGIVLAVRQVNSTASMAIAEAAAVALDTKKGYARTGLDRLAAEYGLELLDLNDDEFVPVPVPKPAGRFTSPITTVRIAKSVLEADLLVNVPVMKTHPATEISVSLKNLKGVIPSAEKKRFHLKGLKDCVIALNHIVRPGLIVADGTVGHEGDGPIGGTPVGLGVIVAGTDNVAVELISGRIMGLTVDEMPLVTKARQALLGVADERYIRLVGTPLSEATHPFRRAVFPFVRPPGVSVVDANACTGCREGVRMAIARVQAMGLLPRLTPLRFYIGGRGYPQEERREGPGPEGELCLYVGKCREGAAKAAGGIWVPGCPPQVFLISDELRELAGEKRVYGQRDEFLPEGSDSDEPRDSCGRTGA